jgi:Luciferase-like monooxygenase
MVRPLRGLEKLIELMARQLTAARPAEEAERCASASASRIRSSGRIRPRSRTSPRRPRPQGLTTSRRSSTWPGRTRSASRASIPGSPAPPYLHDYPFHEPFTLFAFLAGVTSRVELVTSVLVLPQRQPVLVAKQAAEVSLLSGGRLRLGVGVGWNHMEFEALGADFHTARPCPGPSR